MGLLRYDAYPVGFSAGVEEVGRFGLIDAAFLAVYLTVLGLLLLWTVR